MLKLVVCAGVLAVSAAEETLSNPATAAPLLGAVADPVAKAALEVAFAQIGELRDELRMTRIELAQERAERDITPVEMKTPGAAVTPSPLVASAPAAPTDSAGGTDDITTDDLPNNNTNFRRMQSSSSCDSPSQVSARSQAVNKACCPSHVKCDRLPATCGTHCAKEFVPFFSDCSRILKQNKAIYQKFNTDCQETQAQAVRMLSKPVSVKMFKVAIATKPRSSDSTPAGAVVEKEFHSICKGANILKCVPVCNAATHGFELLANVDGLDTKFSCNLGNNLYSWLSTAAQGGYIGTDPKAFTSAVNTGAAGTYFITLKANTHAPSLRVRSGQNVFIVGNGWSWNNRHSLQIDSAGFVTLMGVKDPCPQASHFETTGNCDGFSGKGIINGKLVNANHH